MNIDYFNSGRTDQMILFIAEMLKVDAKSVQQAVEAFEAEYPESNGFSISDIFDENERSDEPYPLDKNNPDHIDIARAAVISVGSDLELHDSDWWKVDEAIKQACEDAGLIKQSDADDLDDDEDDDWEFDDDDLLEDDDEDDDGWGAADEDEVSTHGPTQHSRPSPDQPTLPDLRYFEGDNKNDYE